PSQIGSLAQHVLDKKGGGCPSFPQELDATGMPLQNDPMPDASLASSLFCLLAVAVGGQEASGRLEVLSQEAEDRVMAAIEVWARSAIEPLAACLGLNSGCVHVLGFDSFFDGLRFGLQCLR